MRVLTDPVETGAVTIALPQDVQAEAFDWPVELFAERVWRIARPLPEQVDIQDAAALRPGRPGGRSSWPGRGVHYSGAEEALRALCEQTGIPVGETQAGKGSLPHGHPQEMGAIGSTGTTAANALAAEADVVCGVGTRWSDFTTASRTAFQEKDVRFVNINVARFDAGKHAGLPVVADAREALHRPVPTALERVCRGARLPRAAGWCGRVGRRGRGGLPPAGRGDRRPGPTGLLTQGQVIGMVNELHRSARRCALRRRLDARRPAQAVADARPKGYHVEYGYSCMGYEVAGGLGVRLACPDRDVFVMVGDGSYLMMATELVTAVQEGIKVIAVLVQNHGYASIGSLSESLGSQRFARTTGSATSSPAGSRGRGCPVDLAANARSLGARVIEVHSQDRPRAGHQGGQGRAGGRRPGGHPRRDRPHGLRARTATRGGGRAGRSVAELDSTKTAYREYTDHKATQRPLLAPVEKPENASRPAP